MQREDQNDIKMPTTFGKESEQLEHAIDRILVMISERRTARSLHGINEQPPYNILTATVELVNMIKMILKILERPPFDCMSEFSSLKNHLIKHVTLLKHLSEQPDLSHEMESDIIDVCKGVTKMCRYIIALPPDLPRPERQIPGSSGGEGEKVPSKVRVPLSTEPEAKSSSVEHEPDYILLQQQLSMPITTTISSHGPVSTLQCISHSNQRVSESYSSPQKIHTPSNEEFTLQHDNISKSDTEVSGTKGSKPLCVPLYHKSFKDLRIIEDTPLMDSGSESDILASDSDRGIASDFEQHSRDSGSVIWEMDSDSEKCAKDSDSEKQSVEDLRETEQHLVRIEQCQVDAESQKHLIHSDSEKLSEESDSENDLHSYKESHRIDSDSDECSTDSASLKYMLKEEKRLMAADSIKRLMESKKIMETENFWLIPDSEKYTMDSDTEGARSDSPSTSSIHMMQEGKQGNTSRRYIMDSDFGPFEMESEAERHEQASEAVKCLIDTEMFQLSTGKDRHWMDSWSERQTVKSDSESPGMTDSMKPMRKAEICQSTCDLEKLWRGHKPESPKHGVDFERKHLDYSRNWDSSRSYELPTIEPLGDSGRCQDELHNLPVIFERDQTDSNSETQQTKTGDERSQDDCDSKRYLVKMESEFENERSQMDEERHLIETDSTKGHKTTSGDETDKLISETEAQRLGARRKENRPPGFWRPILPHPPCGEEKKTKEHSLQHLDDKFSRIQLMKQSDDKTVRFKEVSPILSDKQIQKKLKEKYSPSLSPDSNTFIDNKQYRKVGCRVSVYKRHYSKNRYSQNFQSSEPQIIPINLSPEDNTSDEPAPVCTPTCTSPEPVVRRKTRRSISRSLDMVNQKNSRCFVEINNSSFHKCPINSDDSDSESPRQVHVSLVSKHSLSSKTFRHHKTSRNNPLSRSLDPKHPVGIRCLHHQEDHKYSLSSTSHLHCESCSALQNVLASTVTCTCPMNSENMNQYSVCGNIVSTQVTLSESEDKFNLSSKLQNEGSPDNETKLVRNRNLKDKADAKNKPLSEDESNTEDKSDYEDETDTENEDDTDSEDEDDTKEKKDPKDKADPDDSNPENDNYGNDTDANNGSDPSSDYGHTSGFHSNKDDDSENGNDPNSEGDPKNGADPNSESEHNTINDVNLKYSTEEGICTSNSDNTSGFSKTIYQNDTSDSNSGIHPRYTSKTQSKIVLDYTSAFNNGAGPKSATGLDSDIFPKNIRSSPTSLGPRSNETHFNNNLTSQDNNHICPKDPKLNCKTKCSNSTSHSTISTNSITYLNYGTRLTSTTGHNHPAAIKYYSDVNYVLGFKYEIGSSYEVNPNYFDRSSYVIRPRSAAIFINATNTSNTICGSGAVSSRVTPGKICASNTNHIPRFAHFCSLKIIINPNFNERNMHNTHNSLGNSNINNPHDLELESISNCSLPPKCYCFVADTNYNFTTDCLIISKFYCPPELGRDYIFFYYQNFGAQYKESSGGMGSASFRNATGSKCAIDTNESGFLKDFSKIQNSIGIKDPASLEIWYNPDIQLPSFDILAEAELPDVVKFPISSGAVNHFFKLLDNNDGAFVAERSLREPVRAITRRSSEVPVWRAEEGRAWGPEGGLPGRYQGRHVVSCARDVVMRPGPGLAVRYARSRSVSPARTNAENPGRERAVSLARGYVDHTVSPSRMHAVSPPQGIALAPARRLPIRYEEEYFVGAVVGLAVKPADGYTEETSRSAKKSTRSTSDRNKNESGLQVSKAFVNFFMKAKAQNKLHLSWFKRVFPSLFSKEDQHVWSKTRFCAIACTELGHGKCEGWLWHKRQSRGISFFSWKKYWFILNHSTLYWFSHLNDTKADGFIYLPEFRIDLASHCKRDHAFQATHARIKDFYFAATCSDEMNYWVSQLLELAYGSSFGDAAANEEYRHMGAKVYAKCVLALKRQFPVVWCNNCQVSTTIVSVKPNFQYRRAQNPSDEFIYFRPIEAVKARSKKQQKPAMASHQATGEGIHQRDTGIISQVVVITTPQLTKELESSALVRPKTSGLLRLEKIPVKSPGVPESHRLDVTGIASPEERGKGTAILVAGVPGKEELDDTEIPTLKFTGFIHLEALINKYSPSSEYSRPRSPRNLWLESPENAESPGSDDLEVARSMYPFRERTIFRRSWAELIEAPLNSEGLHVLQTTTENRKIGYLQLQLEKENLATTPTRDQHFQALQCPFPLLHQRPKLQRQRSHSLPRCGDVRSPKENAPSFTLNPEEKHFLPTDHNLLKGKNTKERDNMEETWQTILAPAGENLPHNPKFENLAMCGNAEIPKDNAGQPMGNIILPKYNVNSFPTVNLDVPMVNPEVLWGIGDVPMGKFEVLGGSGKVPRGSHFKVPMGNLETFDHSFGTSRCIGTSPLTELSKIGEHRL